MKKSQISMEYIHIYAIVFLAVTAVLFILYYAGVADIDMFIPDKCVFLSGMECLDNGFKEGQVMMLIQNELGFDIYNINLSINGAKCSGSINISGEGSHVLANGKRKYYYIKCGNISGRFDAKIKLDYTSSLTDENHSKVGYLSMKI